MINKYSVTQYNATECYETGLAVFALVKRNLKCIVKSIRGQTQKHPYCTCSFYMMFKRRQKESIVREFGEVIAFEVWSLAGKTLQRIIQIEEMLYL